MSKHAALSPSSLTRVKYCPGSFQLYRKYNPVSKSSIYAEEGTIAHEAAEKMLSEGVTFEEAIEEVLEGKDYPLTGAARKEMEYHVGRYVDYCREVAERNEDSSPGVEVKLNLESFIPKSYGTADFRSIDYVNKGWIDIVDYKHGQGVVVNPENNQQLLAYAIGAAIEVYGPKLEGLEGVRLHVFQPRLENIACWIVSALELMEYMAEISNYTHAAWEGKRDFNEGRHCQFCAVKNKCPIKLNRIANTIDELTEMDDAERYEAFAHKSDVNVTYKAIEEEMHEKLLDGEVIPNYHLVPKVARRQWDKDMSPEKLARIFQKVMPDLTEDDFYDKTIKSPAKVENLMKMNGIGKETRTIILEQLINKKQTGTKVERVHKIKQEKKQK